jgi:hypothetical protein
VLLDPVLVFAPLAVAAVWRLDPAGIRMLPARLREGFTELDRERPHRCATSRSPG